MTVKVRFTLVASTAALRPWAFRCRDGAVRCTWPEAPGLRCARSGGMGFLVASDEADSTEIEMHAVSPDGRDYSISSFTSVGIAGPPFLGVEAGAPRWARSLANLVNRGLGQLPRKPTEEPLTILYVFDGQGRQVCVIWTTGRAEAERKAIEVVAEIQAGSFDPSAYDTGPG